MDHANISNKKESKKRAPPSLVVECGVCAGPAPDHVHFGARCCYSCRAFFRRRAQRAESHRCRSSGAGDCAITAESKKCISCRYNKCLSIGMDPALVRGAGNRRRKSTLVEHEDEDDDEGDLEETVDPGHGDAGLNTMIEEEAAPHQYGLATPASATSYSRPLTLASPGLSQETSSSLHLTSPGAASPASAPSLSHPLYSPTHHQAYHSCHPPYSPSYPAPAPLHPAPARPPPATSHYPECPPSPGPSGPSLPRPSVIMRAVREVEDPAKLQLQADILKFHGNILTHTGNLFSYHANLLGQQKRQETVSQVDIKQEAEPPLPTQRCSTLKMEADIKPEAAEDNCGQEDDFSSIADQVYEEAQELLVNSPWILGYDPLTTGSSSAGSESGEREKAQILDWLQSPSSPSEAEESGFKTSVIQKHK